MTREPSVRARVHAARRRWLGWRACESVCIAGAVAGVGVVAAARSGASPLGSASLSMAVLAGALAGASWLCERATSPLAFARRLDLRLGEGGALATAYECEIARAGGPLAGLLARRVLAGLGRARLAAAAAPPSLVFFAALSFGAALAALAEERARRIESSFGSRTARADAPAILSRLSGALARSAEDAVHPPDAALSRALVAAEALATEGRPVEPLERAALERGLADLERFVEAAESGAAGDPRTTAQARAALAALRERAAAGGGLAGGPEGSAEPSGGEALAAPAAMGTMSGSRPEVPVQEAPSTTSPTPPEPAAGSLAGRWWPRRMDAVVAGYVERARAARRQESPPRR